MNPEKKIYMYTRISNRKGTESIAHQELLLRQYVEQKQEWQGRACIVIKDIGFTGRNFRRPGWERLLHAIEQQEVEALVVKDLSRIGRDYLKMWSVLLLLQEKKVRLIGVSDGVDTFVKEADFSIFLETVFHELYSQELSLKQKATRNIREKEDRFLGDRPPFGYRKQGEDLVKEEGAAEIVRRIFRLREEGMTIKAVAEKLNEEKISTPGDYENARMGKVVYKSTYHQWSSQMVSHILHNGIYQGFLEQGKRRVDRKGHRRKGEIHRSYHEDWKF